MRKTSSVKGSHGYRSTPLGSVFPLIIACLLAGSLSACSLPRSSSDPTPPKPESVVVPASYDEIYDTIETIHESQGSSFGGGRLMMEDVAVGEMAPLADSSSASIPKSFSETNVQVAGVDEGDVLKTDGNYLYMISEASIIIAEASGEDTKEIARIALDSETLNKEDESINIYASELYISEGRLMVLYNYSPENSSSPDHKSYYAAYYRSVSEVACFDITEPSQPQLLGTFGQDGSFSSSRLYDGVLYLVSNFTVYDETEREDPGTYIPLCYTNNQSTMLEASDICILPDYASTTYSIVSSIDIESCTRVDQLSLLGSNNALYMSTENLYVAGYIFDVAEGESYQDGSFTVTEYTEGYHTRISKLSLTKGAIEFVAEATLPGTLLNQFSLDEYESNLRVVTTFDQTSYRTIADEKGEVTDYDSYEMTPTTNGLYILDENLQERSSLDGLAEDERVYSVRFDGETGYFVTFKQIDPLFAVDLSNPDNPSIKSELKIPGFSTYMHPYAEGRLFGLGMSATETGQTQGMKMSMFDTSDPYNISEKYVLDIESDYSEALYNHKAILIDQAQDIIGFPSDNSYLIYGYSDEKGFYPRAELARDTDSSSGYYYYSNPRGLYINEYFYLCSEDGIGVYALEDFKKIVQIALEIDETDSGNVGIMPLGIE